ncbi:hypothetical protein GCM10018962_16000 [Dactylosporangium matsuzakiense]|uniref:Uncharacterized protein n=2 Tax=Dactylosporangium matsuzakiense TaxID=53360 RepID=A0A9W6NMB0_9ACTN|nr:hypothetical protein GCM10017581_037050 [Dactylosporangium matsuzakiense]
MRFHTVIGMTEKNVNRTLAAVLAIAALHVLAIGVALLALGPAGAGVIVPHLVLAVLLPLRAYKLRGGRPKARRILTVVLGIQIVAHATLPGVIAQMPGYAVPIVVLQALSLVCEVAAIVFLWAPGRSGVEIQERGPELVGTVRGHG